jgi:hypothetical protein
MARAARAQAAASGLKEEAAMNALLILDEDAETELSEDLKSRLLRTLEENGHRVDVYALGRDDVTQCLGCLLCLTKHPGQCVNKDIVNEIRQEVGKYLATFFLTPVRYGHYSATMAAPINKGTGSHRWQVIIGYGEAIDPEEKSTFTDLTAKHRGEMDIVHPGMDRRVDVFVSESVEDNGRICRDVMSIGRGLA